MTFRERRQSGRSVAFSHERDIVLKIGDNEFAGKLVNFSLTGALVEFIEPHLQWDIGGRVSAFFQSGCYLFNVQGVAVRATAKQLAIQFSDLSSADEKEIKNKLVRMQILASRISR